MGLLGNLIKTAVNVVTLPVAVAVDVLDTLDGDTQESQTKKQLENIVENISDAVDDIL
jgi:hypothetical protein